MPENVYNPLAAMVGYIQAERDRNRKQEDDTLNQKIALVHDLISGPGANPARTAQGYADILQLMNAKGGKGKQKSGMGGFMGEHEDVIPSLLAGLTHGDIPFQGPTHEVVQHPGFENAASTMGVQPNQTIGQHFAPGFDGKSVLDNPVTLPPPPINTAPTGTRMLDAARAMQTDQPVSPDRQPIRMAPEELAQQEGNAAGIKAGAIDQAKRDSERQAAIEAGLSPEEYKAGLKHKLMGNTALNKLGTAKEFGIPTADGEIKHIFANPLLRNDGTVQWIGSDGLPLSPDAVAADKLQQQGYTVQTKQMNDGSYQALWIPKMPPAGEAVGAQGIISAPTGVKGRIPPPPQGNIAVLAAPDTGQAAPYRVTGTTAKPITFGNQPGANGKPQQALKPLPSEKMSAAGKQALLGINTVGAMINPLMSDLQTAGLSNNPMGPQWDLFLAQHHISPGAAEESLLQTLGIADAYGLRGLMGGRPNMRLMDIVRVHLPQPGDSTQLAYDKLHTLSQMLPRLRQAIEDAESTRLPERSPYNTGAPAGSANIPAAPSKNPYR